VSVMHIRILQSSLALVAALSVFAAASPEAPGEAPEAALVRPPLPGHDPGLVDTLVAELKAAGYAVSELDAAAACDPARLTARKYHLLVVPDAAALPAGCVASVTEYLKAGGDLIALNAPLWQSPVIQVNGRWVSRDEYQQDNALTPPPNVLFEFRPEEMPRWQRSSNTAESPTTYESVAAGPEAAQHCLHAVVSGLGGWDTFLSPETPNAFPAGHTLTVLSARGGSDTPRLAIEWTEKDGSRWIAVIELTPQWRRYVLTPNDFLFWESNPARGHGGDHFKPENAVRFSVGVAFSHTGHAGGRREYWVGPVGTARMTPEYEELISAIAPPPMDTLSPGYKFFDCHEVQALRTRGEQAIVDAAEFPVPARLRSPQPRASGAGFGKGRAWRFIPLIEARTGGGQWRGTPATLLVHADGAFKGGVWASFGAGNAEWYGSPAVIRAIGQIARRMSQGVFIIDGGANFYTYFDGQQITLGVRAANLGDVRREALTARVTLSEAGSAQAVVSRQWPLALNAGQAISVSDQWKPEGWPEQGFRATAEIVEGGRVIDRVVHEVRVWRPKSKTSFVTIRDGDFVLDGRRWRANGVNYMPSSGVGTEDGAYFEHWMGARSYDPEVIERDLRHIKDLGLNAVSIFIHHQSVREQNLLDLLRRLDSHGLKANLAPRPSWPLKFDFAPVREIIDYYRLWEHDEIFAFDLAWEPMFGMHEDRTPFDADWEAWVVERYGSLEAAEKDWACRVPRTPAGKVTNPRPEQIDTDGPWRRMTAAYRRFLDTLLYTKYSAARALVRGVDPNHFVSFRMAEAANPTFRWAGRIPYDFPYLAGAVDFLAPEAYGRIGDWEQVKPGWFEFEYARWAAPDKPTIWAEAGVSAWDLGRMEAMPDALEFQARLYGDLYRMMIRSGADGVFFWYYPGGFRCYEKSDFGIINPDGSDRPVSKVIRENARKFLDGPDARPIDHWIEIDRDAHPDGIAGIYDAAKAEFWKQIDAGRAPGLRTAGTGTTSANCPLLAVGNTPCNGTNPPKYLDAAFDAIEVQDADGRWTRVQPGDAAKIRNDKPVAARMTLTNLGEAKWLKPDPTSIGTHEAGGVYIVTRGPGATRTPIPAAVPHLESIQVADVVLASAGVQEATTVTITLTAEGRTPFGPNVRLTLIPR
jgi:hypothetical protein